MKNLVLLLAIIPLITISCERHNGIEGTEGTGGAEIILSNDVINSDYSGTSEIIKITSNVDYDIIGYDAFYGCTNLSSIVIGKYIQEIEDMAFYNVAVSRGTYIYATTPPRNGYANFYYDNGRYQTGAIRVPSSAVSVYQEAWPGYTIKAM